LGGGIVLREYWHCQDYSQQHGEDSAVFHFTVPPRESGEPLLAPCGAIFNCVVSLIDFVNFRKATADAWVLKTLALKSCPYHGRVFL
jgi:hypothetical protein